MNLQIFCTKKCPDTKKAERFFKERGVKFHFIDLAEKGMSPGELRSVLEALGADALMDTGGARWRERGLQYMDFDIEEELLKDPLLLKTPVVRDGRKATAGHVPGIWSAWLKG
jgi:arsenate reductase